jgi:hypothetical protein
MNDNDRRDLIALLRRQEIRQLQAKHLDVFFALQDAAAWGIPSAGLITQAELAAFDADLSRIVRARYAQ